jgi:hypothetical protein
VHKIDAQVASAESVHLGPRSTVPRAACASKSHGLECGQRERIWHELCVLWCCIWNLTPTAHKGYMACAERVATAVNVSMWMSTSVRGLAASQPATHPLRMPTQPTQGALTHSKKRQRTTKKLQEKKACATTCLSHQWGCAQGGGRAAVKSAVFGVLTGRVSASRRSSPPRPKKILRCVPVARRQKSSSFVASRSHGQIVTCYVTVEDIYIRTDPDSREGKSSRALCSWRG